ncbi:MAG: beta-ketoacyl-[acyl-carrier-protein] synthase II, partial [Armatimonadetes bacterium]|nr:beta-ketoacyl-[acyl-carrier-protein] synthase II [Armatimonadota bacterium]
MEQVAITGMGCVSPLGLNVEDYWQALCAGTSGAGPITQFDPTDYPTRIAGEVKGF